MQIMLLLGLRRKEVTEKAQRMVLTVTCHSPRIAYALFTPRRVGPR